MSRKFSEYDQRRIETAVLTIARIIGGKLYAIEAGEPGVCIDEIEQAAMVMLGAYTGELPPLPIGAVTP